MYGLRIGLSGLLAQRQGLDTTGHNITNANTEGYSRQRVVLQAVGAPKDPAIWSKWFGPGAGVAAVDIQRLRDMFLESRGQHETGTASFLSSQSTMLGRIEQSFGEPGVNSIQAAMAEFYAAADDVANRPTESSSRIALQQRAEAVASAFQTVKGLMASMRADVSTQVESRIQQINSYAQQVADLNDSIQKAVNADLSPNDLQDQRDLLISKLSELVNVRTQYNGDGTANVFVGASAIVRGKTAQQMTYSNSSGSYVVEWGTTNINVQLSGGELASLVQAYNTQLNATGSPGPYGASYPDQLQVVAEAFANSVNAVHTAGFDLNGVAGLNLFQFNANNDLILNPTIAADSERIAASGSATNLADNSIALQLANIANSTTGATELYRALIAQLGIDSQTTQQKSAIQQDIKSQVDSARQGEAGVNIDEEMTQMLAYQRAYDASARFITAMDEVLNKLINGTGIVGR